MRKRRADWDTNRDTAKAARHAKFWCSKCDHYLVGTGQKCPYCGYRNEKHLRKKPYPD